MTSKKTKKVVLKDSGKKAKSKSKVISASAKTTASAKASTSASTKTSSAISEKVTTFVNVPVSAQMSGSIHYRRCHICNQVSESDNGRVHACGVCGKVMAPFFFFEESETVTLSEVELRPFVSPGQHPPVRGLTAFW